jgi:hypothetical protein
VSELLATRDSADILSGDHLLHIYNKTVTKVQKDGDKKKGEKKHNFRNVSELLAAQDSADQLLGNNLLDTYYKTIRGLDGSERTRVGSPIPGFVPLDTE